MGRPLLACALASCLLACGGAQSGRATDRAPDLTLEVTFGGHDKPPSFDPRSPSPRVRKAYAELVDLVGHDFHFHFDEALIPKWTMDFDTLFAQCIEAVVEDLAALRREHPGVFAEAAPHLQGLDVAYHATALRIDSTLDGAGTVHVVLTPDAWDLVPPRAVSEAIFAKHDEAVDQAFAGKDPASVPRDQWPAYWEWVQRADIPKPASPDPGDDAVYYVDARHILAVARFAAVIGSGTDAVHVAVTRWMLSGTKFFANGYEEHADVVRGLPPGSTWKRAEQAWVAWATASWPSMDAPTRRSLLDEFVTPQGAYPPAFDAAPLGFDVMHAWVQAGHPGEASGANHDPLDDALTYVVCPTHVEADGRIERAFNCGRFWDYALGDDRRRKRTIDFVLAQHDLPLVDELMFGTTHGTDDGLVVASSRWPITLAAWDGLAVEPPLWREATRVVGDGMTSYGGKLYDETVRDWRQRSRPRGPLLYVVASLGSNDGAPFKWEDLPATLGAPVARAELDDYLGMGKRAFAMLPSLWPLLGAGWSRADVIAAHLDPVFDGVANVTGGTRDLAASLERVGKAMCAGPNAVQERSRLRTALASRAKGHPDEARTLEATVDALGASCK